MNQQQQFAIDYLREENRVLREQLGGRRVRLNDDQRRRLAAKAKKPGRRILEEVAGLVTPETLMAWGYRRILGALSNLGYQIARGTIANILKNHGIEPAPEREKKTTWKEFLRRHWSLIVAADFFN